MTSVLIDLFESMGHLCDPQYLKPILLAFFGSPRLAQNGNFWGYFSIRAKVVGYRDPHPIVKY